MGLLKLSFCSYRKILKYKSLPNFVRFKLSRRKNKTLLNSQLEEECLKEEQK